MFSASCRWKVGRSFEICKTFLEFYNKTLFSQTTETAGDYKHVKKKRKKEKKKRKEKEEKKTKEQKLYNKLKKCVQRDSSFWNTWRSRAGLNAGVEFVHQRQTLVAQQLQQTCS